MNILVFSWRDPRHPLAGGAEQVMHEHMKGWVKAGHKVTLFASRFKSSDATENLDGVKIVRYGHEYLGVHFLGFLYYLKERRRFDFVVDQFHGIPFFTPFYVRKPKMAVIQEPAREVWFLNPLTWPFNWIVGIIGYIGEPFIFLLYRWTPFMTGSESAKEDVGRLGIPNKNITVVPHGVIIKRSRVKGQKSKVKTIVYLGILTKDKGIEDALRCFSILNKWDPSAGQNLRFWIIGKAETDAYFNRLKRMVESLGLSNKVRFCGFVSQKKKFELLTKAHVMINPSVREGWGLVNIEANAMGTPVVAYRSPGLVDSVKDGQSGILCKENTPEELAKEVFNLLNNPKRFKKLQKGAVSWSESFSWQRSRKLSLKLVEKIAKS